MEGTIIWRHIQKLNKKLWQHNLVGIVLLLGLGYSQYNYLYNCFLGAEKINADRLIKLDKAEHIDREFVTFTATQIVDTGINTTIINKKTKIESIDTKYAIAMVGRDKVIIIEMQPDRDLKNLTLTGKLSKNLVGRQLEVFKQVIEDRPNLKGKVLTSILKKGDYKSSFSSLWYSLLAGLSLCSWNLYKTKVRTKNPRKHPIYRSLLQYGDGDSLVYSIDNEIKHHYYSQELTPNTFFVTPSWLLFTRRNNLHIIKLDRLIWVFKKVTSHSINFIPTGKTYTIVLCDRLDKEQNFSMSEKEIDRIINRINLYTPWVISGFSSEIKKMWDRQRQELYTMVEQRKQMESHLRLRASHTSSQQESKPKATVTSPKQEYKPKDKVTSPPQESQVNKEVTPVDGVNPETRKRAIAFAGYDKSRIERLLSSVRRNHPNKSEQWYWEKILYDMERDRGF
jgi:hypothetical protein